MRLEIAQIAYTSRLLSVDAAKAGAGNMEIIVSTNGENVPNFVEAIGGAQFKVSFTPNVSSIHTISVKFNRESVPGSPVDVRVEPSTTAALAPAVALSAGEIEASTSKERIQQTAAPPTG